MNFNEMIRTIK